METKTSGNIGEVLAENFLKKKGYLVLERNFSTKIGEIDLICKDKDYIVFVEVKTRTSNRFGYPREAINFAKQQKVRKTAQIYLKKKHLYDVDCRFDCIEVLGDKEECEIEHYIDAF